MRREDQAQPRQAKRSALPSWLNGQTVALLGSMLVLGMFCQNGFTSMRQDMNSMRTELKGDIAKLRTEVKGDIAELRTEVKSDIAELRKELKGDIAELRTDFRRLEDRTRALEVAVTGINVRLDNLERVVAGVRGLAEGADLSACDRAACERLACETPPCKGDPPADASPT